MYFNVNESRKYNGLMLGTEIQEDNKNLNDINIQDFYGINGNS